MRERLLEKCERQHYMDILESSDDSLLKKVISGSVAYYNCCSALEKEFLEGFKVAGKLKFDEEAAQRYDLYFDKYIRSITQFTEGRFDYDELRLDKAGKGMFNYRKALRKIHIAGASSTVVAAGVGFLLAGPMGAALTGSIMGYLGMTAISGDSIIRSNTLADKLQYYQQLRKVSYNMDRFIESVYRKDRLIDFVTLDLELEPSVNDKMVDNSQISSSNGSIIDDQIDTLRKRLKKKRREPFF